MPSEISLRIRVRYSWWPHLGPSFRDGVLRVWLLPLYVSALWRHFVAKDAA